MKMVTDSKDLINKSNEVANRYNNRSFIGKIIHRRPDVLSEEQKQAMAELINNSERNLDDLRAMVNVLPLFINGEEVNWPD